MSAQAKEQEHRKEQGAGEGIRRAHREARRYSHSETRVLLAVASFDGRIRFLNRAWESVLGADAKPQRTRPLRDILSADPETADIVANALLDRRCRMPIEIGIRDASGKTCRFLWHRRYDPNDQLMYFAGEEVTTRTPEATDQAPGEDPQAA